jgi:hypothetical protein
MDISATLEAKVIATFTPDLLGVVKQVFALHAVVATTLSWAPLNVFVVVCERHADPLHVLLIDFFGADVSV